MRVAIVHDYLNQYGGAEKVIEILNTMFPEAPIFTSIYSPEKLPDSFKKMDIRGSFMQKLPFLDNHFKKYLLFYPKAIESFDLSEYELILSSSSAFAKGAIKNKNACHICYCYTPMRFVWDYKNYIEKENFGRVTRFLLPGAIRKLKSWDLATINRVDHYIGISQYIKDRIKQFYRRDAEVIYPPVNVKDFDTSDVVEDYFLIVSRLNAYKNIDLVIEAFNELNMRLKIVGTGPYKDFLESLVKSKKIEFLGRLDYPSLKEVYSKCLAYIFPGKEDFGITPVEAQASGRPVIAYSAGGALETVIDGKTGMFFSENSKRALIDTIKDFLRHERDFKSQSIMDHAMKFDTEVFKSSMLNFIKEKFKDHI
jgi:glycosyltransferase involved in cell wall biosynthesis